MSKLPAICFLLGGGAYLIVARLSHLAIERAPLSRWSTVILLLESPSTFGRSLLYVRAISYVKHLADLIPFVFGLLWSPFVTYHSDRFALLSNVSNFISINIPRLPPSRHLFPPCIAPILQLVILILFFFEHKPDPSTPWSPA